MKKNKFIYKIVFGIMLAIGLFFNSDKAMAEASKCVYEYNGENGINGIIEFAINNGELSLLTNTLQSDGTSISLNILKLTKGDVKRLDTFRSLSSGYNDIVNNIGLNDLNIENAKSVGFQTKIKMIDGNKCPQIYVANNSGKNKLTIVPGELDYNSASGSLVWDDISIGADDLFSLKGPFIATNNKKCTDEQIKELQRQASQIKEETIHKFFNEKMIQIQNLRNDFQKDHITAEMCDYFKANVFITEEDEWEKLFNPSVYEYTNRVLNELTNSICDTSDIEKLPLLGFTTDSRANSDKDGLGDYVQNFGSTLAKHYSDLAELCYTTAKENGDLKEDEFEDKMNDIDNQYKNSINNLDSYSEGIHEDVIKKYKRYSGINLGDDVEATCDAILGQDLIDLISKLYGYVKMAAPILLLVFGTVDFGTAVISQDKDALEKAFKKFIKRAIICAAIFFIPIILNWLLSKVVIGGTPLMENPMCGIK